MSELKVILATPHPKMKNACDGAIEVYLKDEADKVIADKDAEIERLKAIRKVHVEAIESMGAGLLQDEEELRHQKYKRCLAMASLSLQKRESYKAVYVKVDYENWCLKWHKRWLAIAEQFKEAK